MQWPSPRVNNSETSRAYDKLPEEQRPPVLVDNPAEEMKTLDSQKCFEFQIKSLKI